MNSKGMSLKQYAVASIRIGGVFLVLMFVAEWVNAPDWVFTPLLVPMLLFGVGGLAVYTWPEY